MPGTKAATAHPPHDIAGWPRVEMGCDMCCATEAVCWLPDLPMDYADLRHYDHMLY